MEYGTVAKWKVYKGEIAPQCTRCGMWMPFARYRRGQGTNAREITDFCPTCGAKMFAIDECKTCKYSKDGNWQENGICYACRGDTWIFGKKHNERILKK
jgi:hypothetical protein